VLGRVSYNISNGLTAGVNLSYDQAFETRFSADLKYRFGGNGYKTQSEKKAWQTPVIQSLTETVKHRDVRVHDKHDKTPFGQKKTNGPNPTANGGYKSTKPQNCHQQGKGDINTIRGCSA